MPSFQSAYHGIILRQEICSQRGSVAAKSPSVVVRQHERAAASGNRWRVSTPLIESVRDANPIYYAAFLWWGDWEARF
jgi:hypothetical protein